MLAKTLLIAVSLLGLALLVRALIEPYQLSLTRVFLPQAARPGTKPGLALRVLFFSDLHYDMLRVKKEKLSRAIQQLEPDLLIFGGDLAARPQLQQEAAAYLGSLCQRPGQAALPFLAVAGNHDTRAGLAALQKAGITVLENDSYRFNCRGGSWQITGLADKKNGRPDIKAAGLDPALDPGRHLIISHNPDNILDLPPGLADYFLAGHFHGGQIWLPLRWEFFLLRSEKLPRQGIYKGLFTFSGMTGFISRGIGCVLLPLRLFSLPELACLEFHSWAPPSGGNL